jgi:ribosome-associated protein
MPARDAWTDDGRLAITAGVAIPAAELGIRATRAGGPGGQHVNTSSTRVEVTWCALGSSALTDAQRARLAEKLASRLDASGTLRVVAADTRSQSQNRELALQRLAGLVRGALAVPKRRRPTKPTRASKERRLDEKKRRSAQKRDRRSKGENDH